LSPARRVASTDPRTALAYPAPARAGPAEPKASGEVEVNTDPALEAEADAKGAAAARHDKDDL
jgi:hypothetical protein